MDQDHIDGLLEHYLHLLHEYTSLRGELATLQTGVYQNIARANFAAERGLRFGRDHYDERMQASRRLAISRKGQDPGQGEGSEGSEGSEGRDRGGSGPAIPSGIVLSFAVIDPASAGISASAAEDSEGDAQVSDPHLPLPEPGAEAGPVEQSAVESTDARAHSASTPPLLTKIDAQPEEDAAAPTGQTRRNPPPPAAASQRSNDPLRWFGLLTPASLRQAQTQSIRVVEHVIPRLASVDAEMAEVEIEVRRTRKRRAKAEAAASRLSQQAGREQDAVTSGDLYA
ncbi:putative mfs-type transporter [Rosellinia necatrix]|uniref:Vacuolar ATPase assembly protein VMA22 n=1 Tax=Rosellinia necatrix TaxID=77044 RepID=A0A1W2TEK5_ROSNE|nr:putative mfs-type transporter [Rosellinia necatrix]